MAILAHASTGIVVQGAETPLALAQCRAMIGHGTRLVGLVGVATGDRGGAPNVPTFANVADAVRQTGAALSLVCSPPLLAARAIAEAIAAGVGVIVCLSEHVPAHDVLTARWMARRANAILIGPNSTGILSPGAARVGYFCEAVCMQGDIGIIAKSGSLAYAVLSEMKNAGLGASTIVGIGGDLVKGSDFIPHLALFQSDQQTRAIVLLGEIGGEDEERAAAFIARSVTKPVIAFVAGRFAPPGRNLGHAGAIVEGGRGGYDGKVRSLASAGVRIAEDIGAVPALLKATLGSTPG